MAAMNKNIVVVSLTFLLDEEEQTRKKIRTRTIWTRPWMLRRKIEDSDGFKGYVRMDVYYFEKLVQLLSSFLQKQDTSKREYISPEERCCVTLRYLASGEFFRSLEYQFRISNKAISYMVYDVAFAITQALGKEHFKTPKATEEWKKIAEKFYY